MGNWARLAGQQHASRCGTVNDCVVRYVELVRVRILEGLVVGALTESINAKLFKYIILRHDSRSIQKLFGKESFQLISVETHVTVFKAFKSCKNT